jgi:hypothetical protein
METEWDHFENMFEKIIWNTIGTTKIKNIPPAHHTPPPQRKTVTLVTAWMFHKGMVIRFPRVQFLNGLIWNSLLFCFVKSFENVLELRLKTWEGCFRV